MSSSPEVKTAATLDAWRTAAARSAPGGELAALDWHTPARIVVKPLYTPAATTHHALADPLPASPPYPPARRGTLHLRPPVAPRPAAPAGSRQCARVEASRSRPLALALPSVQSLGATPTQPPLMQISPSAAR